MPGVFLIWLAGAAVITGLARLGAADPAAGADRDVRGAGDRRGVRRPALAARQPGDLRRPDDERPRRAADRRERGGDQAIEGGRGRVQRGDSEWLAKGPDAEPGTRMRVSGHEGAVLVVERLD